MLLNHFVGVLDAGGLSFFLFNKEKAKTDITGSMLELKKDYDRKS